MKRFTRSVWGDDEDKRYSGKWQVETRRATVGRDAADMSIDTSERRDDGDNQKNGWLLNRRIRTAADMHDSD